MYKENYLRIAVWIPFLFSGLLSALRFYGPNDSGATAFYSFLPLCFFLVAALQMTIIDRIKKLDEKIQYIVKTSE